MQQFLLNPYKVGPPVVGTDFYGRQSLLFKVREALRTSNVVLLQGQRRIGKTSFLKQLSVFLNAPQQEHFVAAIFDIQRYIQDTLPQFQLHLASAIAKALQLPVPSLAEWEADYTLFRDTWLPQVYERLGDQQLVILVDEFDNLEGQTAPQVMQTLIPFLGQLVSGETQLKWVLTLGRQTGKLPIQYDPIISVGVQFRMSFLSLEETRQLVEKPTAKIVDYQPDAIARIYKLTNGQPHLTQALCSELFQSVVLEQERESVSEEDVDAVIPHTLEAYSSAIASIVRVPPIEERVLVAVAQLTAKKDTTNREEIINLLVENNVQQINRDDLTAALDSLLDWELLSGDIQAMRVSVELVRMWLVQNLSVEPNPQESLEIQHILAQSRFKLAEQLRQAGQYKRAIEDYKETLNYIPSHVEALRGLAEAYRLTGNLAEQVDTLQKLYSFERGVLNELVEALEKYAEQAEGEKNFGVAVEQYEELIKLQNCDRWQQKFKEALIKKYDVFMDDVKENFELKANLFPLIWPIYFEALEKEQDKTLAFMKELSYIIFQIKKAALMTEKDINNKTSEFDIEKIKNEIYDFHCAIESTINIQKLNLSLPIIIVILSAFIYFLIVLFLCLSSPAIFWSNAISLELENKLFICVCLYVIQIAIKIYFYINKSFLLKILKDYYHYFPRKIINFIVRVSIRTKM
jgi:tetratricopeptide (TPR) repeat protein